jgi:D-arabinose 1-dehydrogenase-like Zn-dependent alcohol dehydrogenase
VVPAVGRTYRLDEAPEALRDLEEGRVRGKAVIQLRRPDEPDADTGQGTGA